MPKKTKKEKVIAELRRKLEATKLPPKLMTSPPPTPVPTAQTPVSQPISYIIGDLKKTFFLAGLAISLELVIYWIDKLEGSKFFKFLR